jgi:hypothetical protein
MTQSRLSKIPTNQVLNSHNTTITNLGVIRAKIAKRQGIWARDEGRRDA